MFRGTEAAPALLNDLLESLRTMMMEHQNSMSQQMQAQYVSLADSIGSRVDQRVDEKMALFRSEMAEFQSQVADSVARSATECIKSELKNEFTKIGELIESSCASGNGSHHTIGSQLTIDSQMTTSSNRSHPTLPLERGSAADAPSIEDLAQSADGNGGHVDESGSDGRVERWECPVCGVPLKHEKSFQDHIKTLKARIHVLPTVSKHSCLFDVSDADHQLLVSPWSQVCFNFWDQAKCFVSALLSRLHPGREHGRKEVGNPNYPVIMEWLRDCRSNLFVPSSKKKQ